MPAQGNRMASLVQELKAGVSGHGKPYSCAAVAFQLRGLLPADGLLQRGADVEASDGRDGHCTRSTLRLRGATALDLIERDAVGSGRVGLDAQHLPQVGL